MLAFLVAGVLAQAPQSPRSFKRTVQVQVAANYLLYLPSDYGKNRQKYPIILFLHGSGERGDDLEMLKVHGPPKEIAKGREFPFIIVSPQCPLYRQGWDVPTLE